MRILKLKGKTEEIVRNQIEKEYKDRAFILSTQKEQAKGPLKWLKSPQYVVTIAVKEESDEQEQAAAHPVKETTAVVAEPKTEPHHERDEASYEMLMELKDQLGKLHEEIGELKRTPVYIESQDQIVHKGENEAESNIKEMKILQCIKDKLVNLGVKPEVCDILMAHMEEEDSEAIIRKLYDSLEEILIEKEETELPQIIFFIGSTGVGKTTTLAKLTAKYVLEEHKKVVLFTSDTYRIAAVEQLKTYADILGVEIEIIYDENELPSYIEKWKHMDHILIDTAGRSHKNEEQVKELKGLMQQVEEKQVFLVLNANTAGKDVTKIIATYEQAEKDFDLILTKLDETDETGNIVNIGYYAKKPIMYLTDGQNVPADIKAFHKQTYITELLGRLNDE